MNHTLVSMHNVQNIVLWYYSQLIFLAKDNHINSANSYLDNHRSPLGGAVDEGQTREV